MLRYILEALLLQYMFSLLYDGNNYNGIYWPTDTFVIVLSICRDYWLFTVSLFPMLWSNFRLGLQPHGLKA